MDIYLIIVIILFALAITDLAVGVSNDAVNFLNSAIGSRAGKFTLLMVITAIGIVLGAIFSGGMMEVARKGIFNPQHFYFNEIMLMFFAVMLTDILLLDTFNSLGFPTSTTVSIVFELLGAAVAMAIIKIVTQADALSVGEYINSSKALAIIFGILLSVVIAFTAGAVIQWLARLLFSFKLDRRMKYFGSVLGGIAITSITYFMLIKGIKHAPFMTEDVQTWINDHTFLILFGSFVFWSIFLQILFLIFKTNILRVIVLFGTMALAMAFASNDLVNFIGVPLAGLSSYNIFMESGANDPSALSMELLAGPVKTKFVFLVLAGLIMAVTLWLSKKARSVIKTSVDLSRQNEGVERFGSSLLARQIVRTGIAISQGASIIVPKKAKKYISKQFDNTNQFEELPVSERPAFDMLRASINLIVASILIAIGTSLKLPLSTTYVTFMVAMGTSLADKAWGRESAVYRITGVISVIGGWFITAFVAFTVAALVLVIINFGGIISMLVLVLIAAFIIYRSSKLHTKKEKAEIARTYSENISFKQDLHDRLNVYLIEIKEISTNSLKSITTFKLKNIKKCKKRNKKLSKQTINYKYELYPTLSKKGINFEQAGIYYVQTIDYLREAVDCLNYITTPIFEHVDNNHKELSKSQVKDIASLQKHVEGLFDQIMECFNDNFSHEVLNSNIEEFNQQITEIRNSQIKRIRAKKDSTKTSILMLNILQESQNLISSLKKLIDSYQKINNSLDIGTKEN
jgi:phosphate/sulfate permease